MAELEVKGLTHTFSQKNKQLHVLNQLNFTVESGEFVALLGPSGCGKSTLFNIIAGLFPPQTGEIYLNRKHIDGRNVPQSVKLCTGAFGYMQQKDLLLHWRTVLKNVLIGPEIHKEPLGPAKTEAHKLLAQLGLQGFANSYPMQLSGGMRQRAALARTLLFRKDILLLDEPFGALDAMTRNVMQSILLDIWNKNQQTILLITHDIEEALLLADKIYLLTARPGTIKKKVYVPLQRPRSITDRNLIHLKAELFDLLQVEMQQVFN